MHAFRYTSGYQPQGGLHPGSLSLTLLVGGGIITAMLFVNPTVRRIVDPVLETYTVPPDPVPKTDPPPPEHRKPVDRRQPIPQPDPKPDADTKSETGTGPIPGDPGPTGPFPGEGTGGGSEVLPPPDPILIAPAIDPRFAGALQPPYPPEEVRAEREGRVTVRVLIGTDGRVRAVERIAATSEPFFAATRRQALAKWRFRPATRDGVPYEAWKVMNVSFVLSGVE